MLNMDETAIAQSILESILEEAGKIHKRPLAATLSYGVMRGIDGDLLCQAFTQLAAGTACEGMALHIMEVPVQIRCQSCGAVDAYELSSPACAACGSSSFQFLPDAPILLEDIDFQE